MAQARVQLQTERQSITRICKILMVEDNDGIRVFLHALLDDEGYHIVIVASGEEMRAALAKDRFDVALIDLTLPGADGGFAPAKRAARPGFVGILCAREAPLLLPGRATGLGHA